MKIKVLESCWTPHPEKYWPAGIVSVSGKLAEQLLKNNNFVKVSETKPEAKSEKEENERHRKKRSFRNRS